MSAPVAQFSAKQQTQNLADLQRMLANSLAFALRRLAAHSLVARSLSSVASLSSQADGVDVTLNWALAKSGVTPKDRAFRNLDAKSLTAHVGKAEAADAKPQVVSVKDAASTAAYTTVMKKVVDHLNQQGSVFTHDGAIGSSGKDHVAVRAIGDNAQSAQIAAELLSVLPARAATQFTPSLTVFSVGSLALSAEERTALGLSASGAALFVNAAKGRVVVLGRVSAAALQSALNSVAAQALGANSSASATALVAAPSADFASLVVGAVDGAALTFLGRTGYSAAWKNAKGFGQDLANVWKSPVNLFLVAKDATGALPTVAKVWIIAFYYFSSDRLVIRTTILSMNCFFRLI